MSYLVDSDWVADYLKGRDAARNLLESLVPDGLAISIFIYAEVYEGVYYGTDRRRHERGFRAFLQATPIVTPDTYHRAPVRRASWQSATALQHTIL